MKKLKRPLLFSLAVLPFAAVGAFFTCLYQFDLYSPEIMEQAITQTGGKELLLGISVIQTVILAFVCSFLGYLLADKTGLWKPVRIRKGTLLKVTLTSVMLGVLFSLDYWTFGKALPQIRDSYAAGLTPSGVLAAVFYGGVIEEVLLRLFFLTLIAFLIWKLCFRKCVREDIPAGVFIAANVIAAFVFAAGHIPATMTAFGELTPLILFRCFLLNGGLGLVFGVFYRKYGIQYAMLSHMVVHIVSKGIWFLLI